MDDNALDYALISKMIVGIGEVSSITGVPIRKLRYWEEKGFINSIEDNSSTTRRYDYINIKKIILIQELVEEGYTLDKAYEKIENRFNNLNEAFRKIGETI